MKKITVFLIDDSQEDIELTMHVLRGNKFISGIYTFRDAEIALRSIVQKNIAEEISLPLILLDMNMPGMGGLEFIRRIKGEKHTREIPIAILTGTTDLPDIKESIRMGVNHYIQKPIEEEDLEKIAVELGVKGTE
ncbi:MAG: response regulator [Bacteroidetes bacterium]|nr:response regulator [Bacteroidota bacterium]